MTLKDIVTSFLNQKGLSVDEYFKQYMRMVTEHLTDLNIYTIKANEARYKGTVNTNNILQLPPDFVDWIKVGVVSNNTLYPITEKESLFLPTSEVNLEPDFETALSDVSEYWSSVGPPYSTKVHFSIEKEKRYIGFTGYLTGQTIGIKYTTSGIKSNGKTLIPIELRRVLVDWLHWKLREMDDNIAEIKVMSAKNTYNESLRMFNKMQNSFTYEGLLEALRSGYKIGPKQ